MGVHNLWQLLAPVGRRVSIETLEGKTLAVDMSVWLTQFIKAMRDDEGKMMKNAHLLGTLRRILKLMFHRIRPLFVFDGETPLLKRRTVEIRRRKRNLNEAGRHSNAQKLLLNIIKQQLLENKASSSNNSRKATEWPIPGTRVLILASSETSTDTSSKSRAGTVDYAGKFEAQMRSIGRLQVRFDDGTMDEVPFPSDSVHILNEPVSETLNDEDTMVTQTQPSSSSSFITSIGAIGSSSSSSSSVKKTVMNEDNLQDSDDESINWVDGYENNSSNRDKWNSIGDNDFDTLLNEAMQGEEGAMDHILPSDGNFDINVMASLRVLDRKNLAEQFRRELRKKNRSEYMSVRNDAELYSLTQMSHFKKSIKLNEKLQKVQNLVDKRQEGVAIDGDGGKMYTLTRGGQSSSSMQRQKTYIDGAIESDDDDVHRTDDALPKTSSGYAKDGFVVDDAMSSDDENDDFGQGYMKPVSSSSSSSSSNSMNVKSYSPPAVAVTATRILW
jgi:DNA excision repair protein ERCC-5